MNSNYAFISQFIGQGFIILIVAPLLFKIKDVKIENNKLLSDVIQIVLYLLLAFFYAKLKVLVKTIIQN